MNQQHEYADVPLVCQVAEHYQEYRQAVVKGIFEEISLGFYEHVTEETTEMLPELAYVEHLHLEGHL